MKKVLVTGATGFIGLHCIKQLLENGYKVKGTIRSKNRATEVLDSMTRHGLNISNLELIETNLLEDKKIEEKEIISLTKEQKQLIMFENEQLKQLYFHYPY